MPSLSQLAETLRDYAVTVAKRNGNETVGELHLLASIRQWEESEFDLQFPGEFARLQALLAANQGESIERPDLQTEVQVRLEAVSRDSDAWELARDLLARLPEAPSSSAPGGATQSVLAAGAATVAPAPAASDVAEEEVELLLSRSLAERIAGASGRPVEDVSNVMVADALAVAQRVLGFPAPQELASKILAAMGTAETPTGALGEVSDLVGELAHGGVDDGDRLGTELALALIDVGEWVAALDDEITREETDRIDDLRMVLRGQLGDRLRAENDAFHAFEAEFDELVGMRGVKDELRKRVEFLLVAKRRASRGHQVDAQRSHMAFLGNPGTGKTTVARLYAKLLHDVGLLPSSTFVETDRSGLVGEYVGHSEKKTLDVLNSADGGVLFIDEAYALADHYGPDRKGFGAEATDVIVKQMEDRRDRLVVIVAGYSKPMEQFLAMNPGLRSRVPLLLEFPDYSDDELVTIAERIADRRSLVLETDTKNKIRDVMSKERLSEGFGNAREVENLLDAAQRNIVARVSDLGNLATSKESATVFPDDIPSATEPVAKRPIGFAQAYL
jgi:AAA+ superfamily predicted ATPase